jgi:Lon protease-like protein
MLIRAGREVGPGQGDDFYPVGTRATMQEVEALPDGRFFVVARGVRRIRVHEVDRGRPYLRGRVEELADPPQRAAPRLLSLLGSYLTAHGVEAATELPSSASRRAVWLVGSVLQTEAAKRQRLLETGDPRLAEELIQAELDKLGMVGQLGLVPPRRGSLN